MEQWLKDNLFQIVVVLGGGIIAFYKLWQFQREALSWREEFLKVVQKLDDELDEHVKNPAPHTQCASCTAVMCEMKGILSNMHERITNLDNRMFSKFTSIEDKIFAVLEDRRPGGKQ